MTLGWRATQLMGSCDDRIPHQARRAHAGPRRIFASRTAAAAHASFNFSSQQRIAAPRLRVNLSAGRLTMCDRIGCMHMPNFKSMDFSRRNFLKATAATTLTMAVGPGIMSPAHAAGAIKSTHGTGFCNLNIFLSHALQTAKEDGVELSVRQHADLRRAGDVPRHRPGRRRPDALHQLHRVVRRRRAREGRGGRRHRGLRDRLASRPQLA